jgi:hypothetical protein
VVTEPTPEPVETPVGRTSIEINTGVLLSPVADTPARFTTIPPSAVDEDASGLAESGAKPNI